MFSSLRSIVARFTRRLPPKLHFFLIQPFSQTPKFVRTLRYHARLHRDIGRGFVGLHLGSGNLRIDGFCNFDGNPFSTCDVVSGLQRLRLNSDSVAVIYAAHVFEHVPRAGTVAVLCEWRRILKPNGRLYLCVPDLEALFKIYLDNLPGYDSDEGRTLVEHACGIIYGGQIDRYDFHFYGYSFATLRHLLESVGFRSVERFTPTELEFRQPEDASFAKVGDIPISLNIRATK